MIEQAKSRVLLEVAIASVDDAVAAQTNGADRLELSSALELGGLTPSPGSLLEVKRTSTLVIGFPCLAGRIGLSGRRSVLVCHSQRMNHFAFLLE